MSKIKDLQAEKILDSSGNWTVKARIITEDGFKGVASVPSGESAGKYEAKKISVEDSLTLINGTLRESLIGKSVDRLSEIDDVLLRLDGTEDKSRLGANTLLAISEAAAEVGARSQNLSLYSFLARESGVTEASLSLPTPLFNMLEGGRHANNEIDFQEFLFIPSLVLSFSEKLKIGITFYHQLKSNLLKADLPLGIGDEGGFAVHGISNDEALSWMKKTIGDCGLHSGKNAFLGLDIASSQFYREGEYHLKKLSLGLSSSKLREKYDQLLKAFPITYLEDAFVEDDWKNWSELTANHGKETEIVGDDLTTTNVERMEDALAAKAITGVIIKPNQIGTITETLAAVKKARESGLTIIVSHRGSETESTFIADFAVASGARYVKFGGPARGERVVKYNRLLEIEKEIER